MSRVSIILDANILIRAVLGQRVRALIHGHAAHVRFFAPDVAYADARKYLPALLEKRAVASEPAMAVLDVLERIVLPLGAEVYGGMREPALQRIGLRDQDDWPVVACALALNCPLWTEDTDFFGTGVATWTSDRVAIYLGKR